MITGCVTNLMEINHPALSPAAVNAWAQCDPCKVTETNAWRNIRILWNFKLTLENYFVLVCFQSLSLRPEFIKVLSDCWKKRTEKQSYVSFSTQTHALNIFCVVPDKF